MTDLLEAIGINFNGVIGHSFGEIGCAYADKCLTKKQALKVAYYRGITSLEMITIDGSMAAIGKFSHHSYDVRHIKAILFRFEQRRHETQMSIFD